MGSVRALDVGRERVIDANQIWRAQTSGAIIAWRGRIVEVVPLLDIVEWMLVGLILSHPVEEAGTRDIIVGFAHQALVDQGIGAGPDGRGGAGAIEIAPLIVKVASQKVGDGGDIWHLAHPIRVLVLDALHALLPVWLGVDCTEAAT